MNPRLLLVGVVIGGATAGWATISRAQGPDLSHGGPITVTARDGMDWRQNEQLVVARGDARAVRDTTTVTADTLIAHYRKKAGATAQPAAAAPATPGAAPSPGVPNPGVPGDTDTEGSEIFRLDAIGNVHIFTPTDNAWGDKGVYDMDQAVLVLTGKALKATSPQDVITARDVMEYWSQKHMSVARGNAVLVTSDGRRVAADTLVAYTKPDDQPTPNAAPTPQAAVTPAAKPGQDPLLSSGKLERVEAFGNVEIRTANELIRGERGVYLPDTGLARLVGNVRITRGQNQVNGVAADVDLKSGVSTLLSSPTEPVHGLIMPNQPPQTPSGKAAPKPPAAAKPVTPGAASQAGTSHAATSQAGASQNLISGSATPPATAPQSGAPPPASPGTPPGALPGPPLGLPPSDTP